MSYGSGNLIIESNGTIEPFGTEIKGDPRCGAAIYYRVAEALGDKKSASMMFDKYGVPGLMYKGSRAETAGADIPERITIHYYTGIKNEARTSGCNLPCCRPPKMQVLRAERALMVVLYTQTMILTSSECNFKSKGFISTISTLLCNPALSPSRP